MMKRSWIPILCLSIIWKNVIRAADAFAFKSGLALKRRLPMATSSRIRISSIPPVGMSSSNDDQESTQPHSLSKSKWKKKRYLMMKDVMDLIDQGDPRAPRKAHEIVMRMQKLSAVHNDDDLLPNEQVYNLWINAIAKCSQPKHIAGKEAEAVLEEMKYAGITPSIISYTSVMDSYANASSRRNRAAQEAERVLFDLLEQQQVSPHEDLKITSITCDTVLKAWANRGDIEGAKHAQAILERLTHLQNEKIRPTVHSYGTVIHAWASCNGGAEAAIQAEYILRRLLQPTSNVKPDTVVFNSAIHAWANSKTPEAGAKAVELLRQMRELHNPRKGYYTEPDSMTYNTVLSAWSHCDDMSAATETERILKEMQDAYKKSPKTASKPNTVSFNSVLHAWSRSPLPGSVERAQAVLEFMIKANKKDIAPDVISFTSVLNALAKSKEPDKAVRARQLLDTMLQMYQISRRYTLKPSQIPFNAVLNACAFSASDTSTENQQDALRVAVATFAELQNYAQPDTVSYGNLMKCFHNLMPPGEQRNERALQLFEKCRNDGLVGELVWTEVRRTVQSRVLARALPLKQPLSQLHVKDLPRSWTQRVRGDKLAARRKNQAAKRQRDQHQKKRTAPVRRLRSISEPSYQSGKDL